MRFFLIHLAQYFKFQSPNSNNQKLVIGVYLMIGVWNLVIRILYQSLSTQCLDGVGDVVMEPLLGIFVAQSQSHEL